jgi:hypothetical protein
MARKIPILYIPRPSKIYPNRDFWFENKPSGNTAVRRKKIGKKKKKPPHKVRKEGSGVFGDHKR